MDTSELAATITFRVSPSDKAKLKALVDKRFVTIGDVMREHVRELLRTGMQK